MRLRYFDVVLVLATLACIFSLRFVAHPVGDVFADNKQYELMVRMFQAGIFTPELFDAYRGRFLVPFLASLFPIAPLVAINIINFFSLCCATFALFAMASSLRLGRSEGLLGALLFVLSFPLYYYGSNGIIDPTFISLLVLANCFLLLGNWIAMTAVVCAAAMVKEQAVLIVFPTLGYILFEKAPLGGRIVHGLGVAIALVVGMVVASHMIPRTSSFVWAPSLGTFIENVARPRFWISTFLSAAPLFVAIAWVSLRKRRIESVMRPFFVAQVGGLIGCAGIFTLSILAAYPDGRFVWLAYPYLLGILGALLAKAE